MFTPNEAYYICSEARRWRRNGLLEDEILREKEQLLIDLGINPEQEGIYAISAIIAHNRIRAWKQMPDSVQRKMLRVQHGKWIYDQVNGIQGEMREEIQRTLAELLGVSLDVVVGITDGLPPEMPAEYFGKDGTTFCYDNAGKREYRNNLYNFTLAHSDLEERKAWWVACMSGIECLEPQQVYIPAGIPPSQIICCENSTDRLDRARFFRNGRKLGVVCVNEPMEQYLRRSHQTFNVLSVDPPGHWSREVIHILGSCRLAAHALTFVNVREQRDPIQSQQEFSAIAAMEQNREHEGDFFSLCLENSALMRMHENDTSKRQNLRELRDAALPELIGRFVGCFRQEPLNKTFDRFYKLGLETSDETRTAQILCSRTFTNRFGKFLTNQMIAPDIRPEERDEAISAIQKMVEETVIKKLFMGYSHISNDTEIRHYMSITPRGTSPYCTAMLDFREISEALRSPDNPLTDFYLDVVFTMTKYLIERAKHLKTPATNFTGLVPDIRFSIQGRRKKLEQQKQGLKPTLHEAFRPQSAYTSVLLNSLKLPQPQQCFSSREPEQPKHVSANDHVVALLEGKEIARIKIKTLNRMFFRPIHAVSDESDNE